MEVVEFVRNSCPSEGTAWFCSGMDDYLAGKGQLIDCLNLKAGKQGSPSIVQKYYQLKQNRALVRAWQYCGNPEDEPPKVSKKLSREIEEFSKFWNQQNLIELEKPLDEWSELTKCLFEAFKSAEGWPGKRFPRSSQRLQEIYEDYIKEFGSTETLKVPMHRRVG